MSDFWFPFYPRAWLSSPEVRLLSPADRGVLVDLLCLIYDSGADGYVRGALDRPMTVAEVAKALQIRGSTIERIAAKSGSISVLNGCPYSAKAAEVLERRNDARSKQSQGGRAGAESRWQRRGAEIFRREP